MVNQALKCFIKAEMKLYKVEFEKKNFQKAFQHLERVHIVSQPFPMAHTFVHFQMLKFAILTFRPIEIAIQLIYSLFSAKFSALNIFPAGNTGGSDAILKGKMEIPADLKIILTKSKTQ